jgi:hypothetical protein
MASIAKELNIPVHHRGAIIDSGATSHFSPNRSKFITYTPIEPQEVHTADGSSICAIGRGDLKIDLPLGTKKTTVTLTNTLYTPTMAFTLISANRIAAVGLAVHFEDKLCKILSPALQRKIIAEILQVDGLYSVIFRNQHHANIAKAKLTVNELHQVLGHVSQTAVLDAVKKVLVEGVELDSTSQPEFCDACTQAKASHQPFPKRRRTGHKLMANWFTQIFGDQPKP